MSKIYEALKKAEREKAAADKGATTEQVGLSQLSPVEPAAGPSADFQLPLAVAEEYSKMFNAIKLRHSDRKIKALLITSSVHGEGTSSVCSQFARSLTQGGQEKVLVVDANLRTPALHHIFGLEREKGFVELLQGSASANELIKETKFPNLFVLTSGRATNEPSRLLSSPHLKEALAEWNRRYSFVLFDSTPVLAYADAVILSRLIEGVVLVVQAGKTRWEVIRRAQETLNNVKAPLLGVVLNRRQYVIPKRVYKRL